MKAGKFFAGMIIVKIMNKNQKKKYWKGWNYEGERK